MVGTLDLADDGSVDFSGLPPGSMWLRQYTAVTEDGKAVWSPDGEEWLRVLPRCLSPRLSTGCWAQTAKTSSS